MTRFDASRAECRVFTFKEGLLSAIAHDLELRVDTFSVEVSDDRATIVATFDARSIRVVDAMLEGKRSPGTLSARDKAKIEANIAGEVLSSKQTEIRFVSKSITARDSGWEVKGDLTLAGRTRSISIPVHREDGHAIGEVTLHQPDYGIKPYSAMLGTLKIQAAVLVRVKVPLTESA